MSVSAIVANLLKKRGISDTEAFLNPRYDDIADPFTMHDMDRAVQRIISALNTGERIVIYSDYDADGIPGAVVLSDFLRLVQHTNYEVYIPHRHSEGYGLHTSALDTLLVTGPALIITCDLGITAPAEVAHALSIGHDIIVTDHHEPHGLDIPECIVVHPKLGSYADPMLCGCAVAFQLVRALILHLHTTQDSRASRIPAGYEKWMLDLVGLSTLADMVPLQNENRIFAHYGLRVLRQARRTGLRALAQVSRIDLAECDETMIGFRIVPYINAASRMGHPLQAYQMMSETDPLRALARAQELHILNNQRKTVVDAIMKNAHIIAQAQTDKPILWVGQSDWHVGVLSIIAGRIAEEYQKPVFVWTGYGDSAIKGSARGINGFNILEVMMGASDDYFIRRGGHAAAGGFTMRSEHADDFVGYLNTLPVPEADAAIDGKDNHDAVLQVSDITLSLVDELATMGPFGVGNTRPVFLVVGRLVERKKFGKTSKHEKLLVAGDNASMVWLLLFSWDTAQYSDWNIGEVRTLCVTVERSGTGRYLEVVMRPA